MKPTGLEAACRVDYRLTYGEAERGFRISDYYMTIDGPDLPDASDPGYKSTGVWGAPSHALSGSRRAKWFEEMFSAALCEALHEVCEWFRVDGQLFVHPHDAAVEREMDVVSRLAARRLVRSGGA